MWECPKCERSFKRTNQDHYCGPAPQTIEEYIAQQPEHARPYLHQINETIQRTLPDAVYVTVRCDQPVNLCGAFEKAVPASPNGFAEPSKQKLTDYAKQVYQYYTGAPQDAFTVGMGLEDLAPAMPLNDMLDALETAVRCHMDGNGVE